MQRTRIKICGVKDVETALAAADAGADAVGLVFVQASPRYVEVAAAHAIATSLPPFVEPIGLFVDEDPYDVLSIGDQVTINTVQLHGNETIESFATMWEDRFRVIKAIAFDAQRLRRLRGERALSAVLVDAPPKAGLTGGSGDRFDWHALGRIDPAQGHPVILAGGLTPENVGEAIRIVRPYAVDVSSGVESSRGVKDVGLIKAFCDAVREADAQMAQQ